MTFEEACDPRFDALLQDNRVHGYNRARLAETGDPVVGLWPDFAIAYLNPAWFRYARQNGAPPEFFEQWTLGRNLLDAIPELLRAYYLAAYEQCLQRGEPWSEDYECSSAAHFRVNRSTAYPLAHGAGLLVVHSRRVERPHERDAVPASWERFANEHGWLSQCAYCRRYAERGHRARWVWVPEWVRRPPATVTHGICEPCASYYFGMAREHRRGA